MITCNDAKALYGLLARKLLELSGSTASLAIRRIWIQIEKFGSNPLKRFLRCEGRRSCALLLELLLDTARIANDVVMHPWQK